MVMQSFRVDTLKDEPIRVGPTFCPADVILISPCRNGTQYPINVIEVVDKFDDLIYYDIATCLFLVVTLLMAIMLNLKWSHVKIVKRRYRRIVKTFINVNWSIYETVVGQNTFDPNSWPIRMLWLFFVMGTFFAVVDILLNLMSTDQVAQIQASRINSLDDLLSSTFAHYQPSVFTGMYVYSLLNNAKPESRMGRLLSRIKQKQDQGLVSITATRLDDFAKVESMFSDAIAGANNTVLLLDFAFKHVTMPLGCTYKPEIVINLYISKDSFAEGILAIGFNKQMEWVLEHYLSYQVTTFVEPGFNRIMVNGLGAAITAKLNWKGNRESFICSSGFPAEDDYDKMITDMKLGIPALIGSAKICALIASFAVLALAIEIVIS